MSDFWAGVCVGAGGLTGIAFLIVLLRWQGGNIVVASDEPAEYGIAGELVEAFSCAAERIDKISLESETSKITLHEIGLQMFKALLRMVAETRRSDTQIRALKRRVMYALKNQDEVLEVLDRIRGKAKFTTRMESRHDAKVLRIELRAILATDLTEKGVGDDVLLRQFLTALKGILAESDVHSMEGVKEWAAEVDSRLGLKPKKTAA